MVSGILEVLLVDARGLRDTDLLGSMDPYVLIQYKCQERRSSVAQGKNPKWNEKFSFGVEYHGGADDQHKLILRIMDKDTFSVDDFVGEASIYLKDLIELGVDKGTAKLPPRKYSIVLADQTYSGEIQVGVAFTPKMEVETDLEDYGGWKQSSHFYE